LEREGFMSVALLERSIASTKEILANVKPVHLDEASPCASWKVRDLVNHIVGSTYWFAATVESGVAPTSDSDVGGPDITGGDIVAAFADGSGRAVAAFTAPGAMEKTLKLPFGEMPGAAFVMMAANDQFQHGWDLAKATGQATDLDPGLAEQLLGFVRAAIPDAFRGEDGKAPFGPEVEVPATASISDQLAGFLGRTP
jgi:uncharacterized protein (TIGR03086 family)